ncbi:MAG: tyrosine-type recombinase/integrase, partial [Micromonosporaceae bacterium]|nr:tyrosine-type recombinase/integrase [Micromonosporaceae bacterium]
DGKPAAANTVARKRAVLYNALRYAVALRFLDGHPMDHVQWSPPKSVEQIDRRVVVNPTQAGTLLAAVRAHDPRLAAFFSCMYYAALRPSEALNLNVAECVLPETGWGWLNLTGSIQHVGEDWCDGDGARETRELKHRAKNATRRVPACPDLVRILRDHIARERPAPDGRLFTSRDYRRGPISTATYTRAWRAARREALTPEQVNSPLARVPYHLRHAAVSTWLNAGVPATQVAEWAGHSVHVLLKVYAACIDGQDDAARRRIEDALNPPDDQSPRSDQHQSG